MILIVEDNYDVLYNLKIALEFNQYEVLPAQNGKEALKLLKDSDKVPDLILSDIMMPEMDGYDFFDTISHNPLWNTIPFIFLTALTSPKDIRIGKMLGVDDYLVKPFKEEDLLASIAGKLKRSQKSKILSEKLETLLSSIKFDSVPSLASCDAKSSVLLFLVVWDDKLGPTLKNHYPISVPLPISVDALGYQLFNGASSIYGQERIYEARGILITIENIQKHGYLYFDAIYDPTTRGKQRPFMLGVVSPQINYLESLKIRDILQELTPKLKKGDDWDIKEYWERVSTVLTTPLF